MSRTTTFIVGAVAGFFLTVAIHTWAFDNGLDGLSRWIRKTTGTERSVTEKIGNRFEELGDTLKGDKPMSKRVRDAKNKVKNGVEKVAGGAKETVEGAADAVKEKAEDVKDRLD